MAKYLPTGSMARDEIPTGNLENCLIRLRFIRSHEFTTPSEPPVKKQLNLKHYNDNTVNNKNVFTWDDMLQH